MAERTAEIAPLAKDNGAGLAGIVAETEFF